MINTKRIKTKGTPDNRFQGASHLSFQTIKTNLTEDDKKEADLEWSYKHKTEIKEEYDKLLEQQKVSDTDLKSKSQLYEIARSRIKEKHGFTL